MTTFPLGTNKIRSINVDTDINVISNVEAISGKKEVVLGDIVKQTIQLNTTPLTETEDRQFQVFLKQIKNYGLIELPLSKLSVFKPIIESTSSITTKTSNLIGANIIDLNLANDDVYPIQAGSYIQFNNIDTVGPKKLHQVLSFTSQGNILSNAIVGFVNGSGGDAFVVNTITGETLSSSGNFTLNDDINTIFSYSGLNAAGDTLTGVTVPNETISVSNPLTNFISFNDTIQFISDATIKREITISPGLDTAITSNTKVNYTDLLGQFRADNGSFNSQSSTLLNNGETTKTYRFRLTEEI